MIYVDADACPVKPEAMRVAKRYELKVIFVANSWMRLPEEWGAQLLRPGFYRGKHRGDHIDPIPHDDGPNHSRY